jgi:hypothetical protein
LRGINNVFRFLLFLSSYIPLFIILLLKNINNFSLSLILILISVSPLFVIRRYISVPLKREANDTINISRVSYKGSEVLNYIVSYIIPFISFNSDIMTNSGVDVPNLLVFVILLLVICSLYMSSNLYYINPILTLFYDIHSAENEDGDIIVLITGKKTTIPKNQNILSRKISTGVYLYTEKRKCNITIIKIIIFLFILIFALWFWNHDLQQMITHVFNTLFLRK